MQCHLNSSVNVLAILTYKAQSFRSKEIVGDYPHNSVFNILLFTEMHMTFSVSWIKSQSRNGGEGFIVSF